MEQKIVCGDMHYTDLSPVVGYEQGGIRLVRIITHGLKRDSLVLREQIRAIDRRLQEYNGTLDGDDMKKINSALNYEGRCVYAGNKSGIAGDEKCGYTDGRPC